MAKYFSQLQISSCLKRLASRKSNGKTHMERTSVLMTFLSFDAVCKNEKISRLDFNPDKTEGKNNRKALELEFTKLVLLDRAHGTIRQVTELGKIDFSNKDPEKRLSSNFLTVPLKKASEQSDQAKPFYYPNRPAAPIIKMGPAATGLKWGIEYHDDWAKNLPLFFSEVKESTPFTDLAIFIARDVEFDSKVTTYVQALKVILEGRYTELLSKFWLEKIEKEKILAKHLTAPFSESLNKFGKINEDILDDRFVDYDKDGLIRYINYLERTLAENDITFSEKLK